MLRITIPAREQYDEINNEFIVSEEQTLELEHSLVALSKWESKWHKPFLTKDIKTEEELIDYVRCMTLTENVDPHVYNLLTNEHMTAINNYMEDSSTATWFSKKGAGKNTGEQTTNELLYYQMIALNIPMECENWHLNRLLTLIRICNEKNQPNKKMSKRDTLNQYRSLNAARRKRRK